MPELARSFRRGLIFRAVFRTVLVLAIQTQLLERAPTTSPATGAALSVLATAGLDITPAPVGSIRSLI